MSEHSYKDARGAAPSTSGMSPEEAIRRVRGDYSDELAALTKQRDALRTALEKIANPADGNDHQNHCHAQRKIARQALAGQPESSVKGYEHACRECLAEVASPGVLCADCEPPGQPKEGE